MLPYSKKYIKKFWVGLMDGDGSIQINHWKKKYLQYRLVIKMKYDLNNLFMFNIIQTTLGGRVRIIYKKINNNNTPLFVIWVVDSKKDFIKLINLLNQYQPKTMRLLAQLNFAKECLKHNNVDIYLNTRKYKYAFLPQSFDHVVTYRGKEDKEKNNNIILPYNLCNFNIKIIDNDISFFNEWLSGFIEAEGCFCIRKNNICSFSISQKDNYFLMEKIKKYFLIQSKIRSLKNNLHVIETYRKESLFKIIEHLNKYPLLGEKTISFNKLKNNIQEK